MKLSKLVLVSLLCFLGLVALALPPSFSVTRGTRAFNAPVVGSSYTANSASGTGSENIQRASAFTGASSTKTVTWSFWVTCGGGSDGTQMDIWRSGATHQLIRRNTDNTLRVYFQDSGGTQVIDVSTTSTITVSSGRVNVLIAIDSAQGTSGNRIQVYFNGSDATPSAGTRLFDGLIDWPDTAVKVFGVGAGGLNGCLGEVYVNPATRLDFSSAPNRAKFYSSGNPVDVGPDGSTPTGLPPLVYLKDWTPNGMGEYVNAGTGGNLTTDTGTIGNLCGTFP